MKRTAILTAKLSLLIAATNFGQTVGVCNTWSVAVPATGYFGTELTSFSTLIELSATGSTCDKLVYNSSTSINNVAMVRFKNGKTLFSNTAIQSDSDSLLGNFISVVTET